MDDRELRALRTVGTHVRARFRVSCEDDDGMPMVVEKNERGIVASVHDDCIVVAFEGGYRIWVHEHEVAIVPRSRFDIMDDLLV